MVPTPTHAGPAGAGPVRGPGRRPAGDRDAQPERRDGRADRLAVPAALRLAGGEGRCDEPVLESTELEQLRQWQGEESDVTQDVWSLFEQRVSEHGGRIAVREGAQSWSYAQLLSRVAHWSAVLGSEGVRAGDAVAVLLERGMDAVTALLAIVRCGGRYVPLDAQYPAERLNWMLSDAGVRCVLSDGALPAGVAAEQVLDVGEFDGRDVPVLPAARIGFVSHTTGSPPAATVSRATSRPSTP